MGMLLAIPAVALGVILTAVIIFSAFPMVGMLILQVVKAVLRVIPGVQNLVPDDPPTEEELEKSRQQEEKLQKARAAAIEEEIREELRPKTLEDAQGRLDRALLAVKDAEADVVAAEVDAKSNGFGWQLVAEKRDALGQAELLVKESEGNKERLGLKQLGEAKSARGVQESANEGSSSPAEFTNARESTGATKLSSQRDWSCSTLTLSKEQALVRTPAEFWNLRHAQGSSKLMSSPAPFPPQALNLWPNVLPQSALRPALRLRSTSAVEHKFVRGFLNAMRRI